MKWQIIFDKSNEFTRNVFFDIKDTNFQQNIGYEFIMILRLLSL